MTDDGKHWTVREPEISENTVTIHSPFFPAWTEWRDGTGRTVELRTDPPDYFTLTPTKREPK